MRWRRMDAIRDQLFRKRWIARLSTTKNFLHRRIQVDAGKIVFLRELQHELAITASTAL